MYLCRLNFSLLYFSIHSCARLKVCLSQRKMQQKIFYRIKLFWSLLALSNYHLLLKITKYVNWRLTLQQKIPLPNYIHILYCEVSFHLFLMAFNSGKSRDGKFSQHFPNIKKIGRSTLD